MLGDRLWEPGDPADRVRALQLWQRAAILGNAAAHRRLAENAEAPQPGQNADLKQALFHWASAERLLRQRDSASADAVFQSDDLVYAGARRLTLARLLDERSVAEAWAAAQH